MDTPLVCTKKEQTKFIYICFTKNGESQENNEVFSFACAIHKIIRQFNLISEENTMFLLPQSEIKNFNSIATVSLGSTNYQTKCTNDFFVEYNDSGSERSGVKEIESHVKTFVSDIDILHIFLVGHDSEKGFGHNVLSYCNFVHLLYSLPVKTIRIYNACNNSGTFASGFSVLNNFNDIAKKIDNQFSENAIKRFFNSFVKNSDIFKIGLNVQEIIESAKRVSSIISDKRKDFDEDFELAGQILQLAEGVSTFLDKNQSNFFGCQTIEEVQENIQENIQDILLFKKDFSVEPYRSVQNLYEDLELLKGFGIHLINDIKFLNSFFQIPTFKSLDEDYKAQILQTLIIPEFGEIFQAILKYLKPQKFAFQIQTLRNTGIRFDFVHKNFDIKIISCFDASENGYFQGQFGSSASRPSLSTVGAEIFIKELFIDSKDGLISVDRIKNSIPKDIQMRLICFESPANETEKIMDSLTHLFENRETAPKTIEELLIGAGFEKCESQRSSGYNSDGFEEEEGESQRSIGYNSDGFEEEEGESQRSIGYNSDGFEEEEDEYEIELPEVNDRSYQYVELVEETFRLYNIHLGNLGHHFDARTYPFSDSTYANLELRQAIDKMDEIHNTHIISPYILPYLVKLSAYTAYSKHRDPQIAKVLPECYRQVLETMKGKGYTIP